MNVRIWLGIVLVSVSHACAAEEQKMVPEIPHARPSAKDEGVSPARHLANVFKTVARERQSLPPIEPRSTRSINDLAERNIAPWSIQTHQVVEHFLVRSLPLELLALEVG